MILLLVVVGICGIRYFTMDRDDAFLAEFRSEKIVVEGLVLEEPDDKGDKTRILVDVQKIVKGEKRSDGSKSKHLLLLSAITPSTLEYGEMVRFTTKIDHPQVVVDKNGSSFDYPKFLAKDDIFYVGKTADLRVLEIEKGSWIKSRLLKIKESFIESISRLLPEPYSLLANGLVVAGKGSLGADLQEQFKRAGVIHIVVLSGFNVTIIAEAVMRLLSFLPVVISTAGGILGIISFVVIAGTSATVIRSAIMSIIAIIGRSTGRTYDAFRALIIAACIMLMYHPDILFYDPSFQLSFAGTLGLMLLGSSVERRCLFVTPKFGLRSVVAATIASQISVTPLILHLSGTFSFVALAVNILILPFVPFTMLFVFLAGCSSFISSFLAVPFVVVSYILLWYELSIVGYFSSFSFAAKTIYPLSWAVTLGIYGGYILVYLVYKGMTKGGPEGRPNA